MKRTSNTPAPVITIQVDSIDEALKKVEAGGGATVQSRTEIPTKAPRLLQGHRRQRDGLWESFG